MRVPLILGSLIAGIGLAAVPTSAQAAPARCETPVANQVRCYQVLSTKKSTFKTLFTDGLINQTSTSAKLECYVEKTTKFAASMGYSFSGGIKIKLLADMSSQSSVNISGEVSATRGSKISKTVPARTTILCDRGTYTYRATIRRTGSNNQTAIATTTKTATAPSAVVWRFRTQ